MGPLSTSSVINNRTGNINGIDLVKFLCAVLIFMVHIPPFEVHVSGLTGNLNFIFQHYLGRIAVPFFFVCSGFFLFKKMSIHDPDTAVIQKYCFKLLKLVGIWHVLLVVGGTIHLWYLGATVVAVLLLSLCLRLRIKLKFICLIACILYLMGLLGDSYYGLIAPLADKTPLRYIFKGYKFLFRTTRNGVFMGFIFIIMGAVLSHRKAMLKPVPAAIGFVLSMLCLLAEVYLLKVHHIPQEYNMYIFLLPAVYFLFCLAYTVPLKDHAIYKRLRTTGMWIFLLHLFVNQFATIGVHILEKLLNTSLQSYRFAISLGATLLVGAFMTWLSEKKHFKWLNLLIK